MIRSSHNPLITPDMVIPSHKGYRVKGAFNPGAAVFGKDTILLLRVAENCVSKQGHVAVPFFSFEGDKPVPQIMEVNKDDPDVELKDSRGIAYKGIDYLSTLSHIRLARSKDGVHFTVDESPFLFPEHPEESFGVEDARVTKLGDEYFITYTAVSKDGYATSLASTKDFVTIKKHGIIFPPQNKDVSIFPEKINGMYCALHRPDNKGFGLPSIWYSESPDLIHWGSHKCLLRPRNIIWEEMKIGGGAAPVKTSEGWLEIYHGKGRDEIYSLFLVLLDLEKPFKVIARGKSPIIKPQTVYETSGFFSDVIFSNGIIERDNGMIDIYYGACDETTNLFSVSTEELLSTLK